MRLAPLPQSDPKDSFGVSLQLTTALDSRTSLFWTRLADAILADDVVLNRSEDLAEGGRHELLSWDAKRES